MARHQPLCKCVLMVATYTSHFLNKMPLGSKYNNFNKLKAKKKTSYDVFFQIMAVSKRFELLMPFDIHAFQACSFGHSDSSPKPLYALRNLCAYSSYEEKRLQLVFVKLVLKINLLPILSD
jgi:hypothetical protein